MSQILSLELVDRDGAIREALDDASSGSREEFLKKAVVAGGTFLAGGVLFGGFPKLALGAPSPAQDVRILNFALTLEYLEAEFYTQAVRGGELSGEVLRFARVVGAHERAHVAFLRKALGGKAVKKPSFDFKGTTEDQAMFQATAVVLEDTGVAAYNGQGPNLTDAVVGAAGQIVSVEARHAAWIRHIVDQNPAPRAFDQSQTMAQILAAVRKTGFITGS
jgi:hypothetical protein